MGSQDEWWKKFFQKTHRLLCLTFQLESWWWILKMDCSGSFFFLTNSILLSLWLYFFFSFYLPLFLIFFFLFLFFLSFFLSFFLTGSSIINRFMGEMKGGRGRGQLQTFCLSVCLQEKVLATSTLHSQKCQKLNTFSWNSNSVWPQNVKKLETNLITSYDSVN